MSNAQGRPLAIACAAALTLAVLSSETHVRATTGPGPQDRWNTFTADVTIRRGLRDEAHQPVGTDGPAVMYRWQRIQSGGRWKTTMSVVNGPRPEVVTPTGQSQAIPPAIARIEDDGDGSGPRFYSLQGTLVRPPALGDRQKMGVSDSVFANSDALLRRPLPLASGAGRVADEGREWVEAVLPSLGQSSARKAALERRFGKALGKLRGQDRYLQTTADETTEVLADETWAVPVEVNIVRAGALESHASFSYEAGPGGSLVRRRSHVEHVITGMNGGKGARMALDVELANVTLEDRR
jgi:hypothetical protein